MKGSKNNNSQNSTTRWSNVFLTGRLATSFFKSAVKTGHITLINPQTKKEAGDLKYIKTTLTRSRLEQVALYYALLFEKVIIDINALGPGSLVWKSDDPYSCRSAIETVSGDFTEFVQITDTLKKQVTRWYNMPETKKVNMYSLCEPLIWNSWKHVGSDRINRQVLRDVLDFFVLRPEMPRIIHDLKYPYPRNLSKLRAMLEPLSFKYNLDADTIRFFLSTIMVTYIKGAVATEHVLEAQTYGAVYPVYGLTFGRNRLGVQQGQLRTIKHEDLVGSVRLFLNEIEYFPILRNLDDVLRLKEHKDFVTFRTMLTRWIEAFTKGDSVEEQKIRKEIRSANHALRRSAQCESIGRFFVYIGIPLVALDAMIGPFLGTPLTLAGFGVQSYSDWLKSKNSWLLIGRSH